MVVDDMVEPEHEQNGECEKQAMGEKSLQGLGEGIPRHHSPLDQHFRKSIGELQ